MNIRKGFGCLSLLLIKSFCASIVTPWLQAYLILIFYTLKPDLHETNFSGEANFFAADAPKYAQK